MLLTGHLEDIQCKVEKGRLLRMSENALKYKCSTVESELKSKGYNYLRVLARGDHIVVYTEEMGEKVNRCRFTYLKGEKYMLGMADHRGRWEYTPYEGTIPELILILTEQFPFVLAEW